MSAFVVVGPGRPSISLHLKPRFFSCISFIHLNVSHPKSASTFLTSFDHNNWRLF